MARRRKTLGLADVEKAKPFDQAFENIDKMEAAYAYRTVTPECMTLRDVLHYLWPGDLVHHLTAAFPYVRTLDRTDIVERFVRTPFSSYAWTMHVALRQAEMLCPSPGLTHVDDEHGAGNHPLTQAMMEIEGVVLKFNKVRQVVDWLNKYATPGAARYYFPALSALLPPDHPFNKADGLRYKEPKQNITEIVPTMREASTIIASGLLADPASLADLPKKVLFKVQVDTEYGASQEFGLL